MAGRKSTEISAAALDAAQSRDIADSVPEALSRVPTGMAMRIVGCCRATLLAMEERGAIKSHRTLTNRRVWDVGAYLRRLSEIQK